MSEKMRYAPIIRTLVFALLVFAGSLALQAILIWWLYPAAEDFAPIKTITGIYSYAGDGSRSRPKTFVGEQQVICRVSFLGPEDSCSHRDLQGIEVTAQTAHYRHIFGTGDVLIKLSDSKQDYYSPSAQDMVAIWRSNSIDAALLNGIFAIVIFNLIRKVWFTDNKETKNVI